MRNVEIREELRRCRVYSYELAEHLGVSESYFSRLIRKELSEEQKEKAIDAIRAIARGRG